MRLNTFRLPPLFTTLLLALVLPLAGKSAEWITGTITITNAMGNGATLTVNSSVRTATNAFDATHWYATNSVPQSATNLFAHIGAYPFAGVLAAMTASNVLTLKGSNLVVVFSTDYGTLSMATQTMTTVMGMTYPSAAIPAQTRTNQGSDMVTQIAYSTNSFAEIVAALSNFVSRSASQTLGNKHITNSTADGVLLTNAFLRLVGAMFTNASGVIGALTNGTLFGTKITNGSGSFSGVYASNGIGHSWTMTNLSVPGTGTESFQLGSSANASGAYSMAVGNNAVATNTESMALGRTATANAAAGLAIGSGAVADAYAAIAIGAGAEATKNDAIAFGTSSSAGYSNSVAIGRLVSTTTTNQIVLGTSAHRVDAPGVFEAGATTNALLKGSNVISGNLSLSSASVSTMAAGPNSILTPTNVVVLLSGPTGAFSLDGASGGWAGRMHQFRNTTAYALTINSESGLEASAANRILTTDGNPVIIGAGEWFSLWYDTGASRWRLQWAGAPKNTDLLSVSNLVWLKPQWEDVPVQMFSQARSNSFMPDLVPVDSAGLVWGAGMVTGRVVYGNAQLPHGQAWTNATFPDLYVQPHVHLSISNAPGAGATNVTFHLAYQWANIGGSYATVSGTVSNTVGIMAGTTHTLLSLGKITNNAAVSNLSGVLRMRLLRGDSPSNVFPGNVHVILDSWDVHVPRMRYGSLSEASD